jgi:hypothetical protein
VIINDKETDEGLCHGAILAGHSPALAQLVEATKDVCNASALDWACLLFVLEFVCLFVCWFVYIYIYIFLSSFSVSLF